MSDLTDLPDLASLRSGGTVVACSDEFFGSALRLLQPTAPIARKGEFDEHGQWMDGWETRRSRPSAAESEDDWVVVRLGAPAVVHAVVVDTTHFSGNQPESVTVHGAYVPGNPSPDEVLAADWSTVVNSRPLGPDAEHVLPVDEQLLVTHLRVVAAPDGGIARFRAHGEVLRDPRELDGLPFDLAAALSGGLVVECSDMHFGRRSNLIAPGESRSMGEGWETRRRRGPGHDWAVVALATQGTIAQVVVDTRHFRGNAPASCDIETSTDGHAWTPLMTNWRLQPDQVHTRAAPTSPPASWLRLSVHPDGGVARLHAIGHPTAQGRQAAARRWLDALPAAAATGVFLSICGSRGWASAMAAARPLGERGEEVALSVWRKLTDADRIEALAAHPRIGDSPPAGTQESREQAGAAHLDAAVAERLRQGNATYEERFGFTYVVRATGRSAEEMLSLLEKRLANDPATELTVASQQQAEILVLRLRVLLNGPAT